MLLATTESVAGMRVVTTIGLVYGTVTRATSMSSRVSASLKGMLGGELEEYTATLAQSREQALDRMRVHARELGANAVLGVRFATADVADGAAEIVAYGTAVVVAADPR
jgi:uncharacterized protein YbjQ (UPF0145 family)